MMDNVCDVELEVRRHYSMRIHVHKLYRLCEMRYVLSNPTMLFLKRFVPINKGSQP
jgi:hypothetical protein